MNRYDVLEHIAELAHGGEITEKELQDAFARGVRGEGVKKKTFKIGELFYYIGGIIVFLGITVLIWQQWASLNDVSRIVITLGFSIVAYILAVILTYMDESNPIGQAFFLLAGLIMPIGLFATFETAGYEITTPSVQTLIASIIFILFSASTFVYRQNLFMLFTIAAGIWLFFAATQLAFDTTFSYDVLRFTTYRSLFVGLVLLYLGYSFSRTRRHLLSGILYGFGVFTVLTSAFILMFDASSFGYYNNSSSWSIIFPLLVLAAIFSSIVVKQKSFLVFGSLYLIAYVIRITVENFTSSIGWPLTLVVVGFVLIIIGYGSFFIHQRYFSGKRS